MDSFIHDIVNDPREYLPFLLLLGGVLLFWGILCVSGVLCLRAGARRRRVWFALPALLLGLPCVLGNIPISMEGEGFQFHADLRWLFIVPLLLGAGGVAFWWKGRAKSPASPTT